MGIPCEPTNVLRCRKIPTAIANTHPVLSLRRHRMSMLVACAQQQRQGPAQNPPSLLSPPAALPVLLRQQAMASSGRCMRLQRPASQSRAPCACPPCSCRPLAPPLRAPNRIYVVNRRSSPQSPSAHWHLALEIAHFVCVVRLRRPLAPPVARLGLWSAQSCHLEAAHLALEVARFFFLVRQLAALGAALGARPHSVCARVVIVVHAHRLRLDARHLCRRDVRECDRLATPAAAA